DRPPADGGNAAWGHVPIHDHAEPIFGSDAGLARPLRNGSTAITGFVLGVFSVLIAFFLPVSPIFPIFLSIAGVVFSWLGRRSPRRGLANAGLMLSGISLLFIIIASLCLLGSNLHK
ncbi:MAG TPA: hypothetical protein VHZ51_17535, partial [Ktedonobacteraceae bacterium]|nr:hypothetical protein [Ktedonobacteraceae bacterium]